MIKDCIALSDGYLIAGHYIGNLTLDMGTITSMTSDKADAFIYKYNFSGSGQWLREIKGSGRVIMQSCNVDNKGDIFVAGLLQ